MIYKFRYVLAVCLLLSYFSFTQTYKAVAATGGGTATLNDVIGVYVQYGTYNTYPSYVKVNGSGPNNNPSYVFVDQIYNCWSFYSSIQDVYYWYYWNSGTPSTFPLGSSNLSWTDAGGTYASMPPTTSQNATANMAFTNGSSYTPPTATPGTNNNPVGRFQLTGSSYGGVLQALTVSFSGTRSGVSNVKLWSSTDNSFNSGTDVQLNSKSDGSSITFNSFNSLVDNSSGTYYFLTVDLASGATGSVTATIPSQASFTFAGANQPGSFTTAVLTSATAPLPVELSSFSAQQTGNMVTLNWSTATEVRNYGFEVEKSKGKSQNSNVDVSWEKIGFVQGNGNSNSPKSYSFVDKAVPIGKYSYRLKQIDFDGQYEYSPVVDVQVDAPLTFALKQNYPNPFNPKTIIGYQLPNANHVILKVYDILGSEVAVLVNGLQTAGDYEIPFDGEKLNSGIYFYKLQTSDGFTAIKKLMLVK
ncbi:MAG: T9SS type A sorting domain-containing protein [Ignavibacteriaceae bacterium]|jgi:hypothetical protein